MEERKFTDQELVRRQKLQELKDLGIDPFGQRFDVTAYTSDIRKNYSDKTAEELEESKPAVSIAGRIVAKRRKGKVCFMNLLDRDGKIQLYIKKDTVGEDVYELVKKSDLGDIIGIDGEVFMTHTGELTVRVEKYTHLTKALRPLPEKFHGLTDTEERFRRRYVDLIMNDEARKVAFMRPKIVRSIQHYLDDKGYTEVETPIMNSILGGAAAKPFITHFNALDKDFYLRIATELNLKRLIVGGMDAVYEIGRLFRNEGMDIRHNPEFTMLELYASYQDFHDMMDITEKIFSQTAQKVLGTTKITYQGQEIDLTPGWKRITMIDSIKEACGVDFNEITTDEEAVALAKERGIEIPDVTKETRGDVISLFFDEYVEKTLIQPTFIYEYPVEISPLAKKCPNNKKMTERFEVFIGGREYGNAFSELNDPIDQYERFKKQVEAKEAGDEEAGMMDEDYINALEIGLPPTGGLGIGIDRFVMLLTDAASIRDVLLFPTMKPLN